MLRPEIHTVSLDGLNNNGKTTQISHLKEELGDRDVPVVVRRGDGSRKGTGSSESDPISTWWQENHASINSAGFEGAEADAAARRASRRLMHELFDLKTKDYPVMLQAQNKNKGVILLDRGPVSRLFVARRYNPDVTLEGAYELDDDIQLEDVMPDNVLVLHAPKEVLITRNPTRKEGSAKQDFNSRIINQYYDAFERVLDNLPPQLAERTTIIDSSPATTEVGRIALAQVVERL